MVMDAMARCVLPDAERAAGARAADLLRRAARAGDAVELRVVRADGGGEERLPLTPAAAGAAGELLARAAGGGAVALLAEDAEVSPEDAAAILGVSRPLVRRRMDAGALPFRRVGAHRRLRLADVLELRRREAPVRAALEELAADTEDLERHGL
jgi:excisionase family DNA binding protein